VTDTGDGRRPTRWEEQVRVNPGHSHWYVDRFRQMAARGADLAGEARMVDAMVRRGARILDAGCGPGRVGAELAARGHSVVGVDVDPVLVEAAETDHPGPTWLVGDLAELDLPARGIPEPFDVVVCAGNVLTFLAPGTEVEVLRRMGAHTVPDGRVVVGFGAGRGYAFDRFFDDVEDAGLRVDLRLSTWDLRPFDDGSDFLVAVLSRP
jgi:2-polyprenyl-3-methyl-5-hydroxy-6-metoxy-1,4-benzoquinol methylase